MVGKILLYNVRKSIQVYERTLVRRNIEQNIEYKLDGQTDLLFNSCEKSDANAGC